MPATGRRYGLEDYLPLEEMSNVRHEFLDGTIYAMAVGTPEHAGITASLIALLASRLAGRPCRVYTSDVRVRVAATGLDTYPDVTVVCGHAEADAADPLAIANPLVLLEVLSPPTEEYDRGEKFEHYQKIPSLREVVFVAHDAVRIEVWRTRDGAWRGQSFGPGSEAEIASLGCTLPVDGVYHDPLDAGSG